MRQSGLFFLHAHTGSVFPPPVLVFPISAPDRIPRPSVVSTLRFKPATVKMSVCSVPSYLRPHLSLPIPGKMWHGGFLFSGIAWHRPLSWSNCQTSSCPLIHARHPRPRLFAQSHQMPLCFMRPSSLLACSRPRIAGWRAVHRAIPMPVLPAHFILCFACLSWADRRLDTGTAEARCDRSHWRAGSIGGIGDPHSDAWGEPAIGYGHLSGPGSCERAGQETPQGSKMGQDHIYCIRAAASCRKPMSKPGQIQMVDFSSSPVVLLCLSRSEGSTPGWKRVGERGEKPARMNNGSGWMQPLSPQFPTPCHSSIFQDCRAGGPSDWRSPGNGGSAWQR
jgi:hypothetical protein